MKLITNVFSEIGRFMLLLTSAVALPEKSSIYRKETIRQMQDIGVGSVIIVGMLALFLGAVAAIQFVYQMEGLPVALYWVGYIVRDAMIMELAPTMSCLVLAGKVGANMASEIGGMRQKEQIDALDIMGVNTAAYLILPRLTAALTVVPLLILIAAFVGISGGLIGGMTSGRLAASDFLYGMRLYFIPYNVVLMVVKSVVFAFIFTCIACYQGYFVPQGSIELGKASTRAVVYGNIFILVADLIIANMMT